MPITRINSGGQTGSDRGGLDAALHCRLPHGGFCPKGRIAEDGVIPARYALTEMPTKDYLARTEANVVDSDATVIFSNGALEGGSLRTAEFAQKHGRPWLHVDLSRLDRQQAVDAILDWLKAKCPAECVLNVAGSRESKSPGIYGRVKARMVDVISKANGTMFYPIGDDDSPDNHEAPGLLAGARTGKPSSEPRQPTDDGLPLWHPKTVAEAARILLDALHPDAKERVVAAADREAFVSSHFGMAMWVRNTMVHRNQNLLDLLADFQRGCREGRWSGAPEPDSVGGVIVGLVWDALHGGG